MLPPGVQPRVITTLHGTDTTLLGHDKGYGPAIRHALLQSDAITTVSAFLPEETRKLFAIDQPIDVIHNFFAPRTPRRSRAEVRAELGVGAEVLISPLLQPSSRQAHRFVARRGLAIQPRSSFKLVILAGERLAPFWMRHRGLEGGIVVRDKVDDIEDTGRPPTSAFSLPNRRAFA